MDIVNIIICCLLLMMLVVAGSLVFIRNLFAAVIVMGIFSLLSASLFLSMDAVDVSFTEAAVGAGIATLLFLATLAQTSRDEKTHKISWASLVIVLVTGVLLLYGIYDIIPVGQADAPVQSYLSPGYLQRSSEEIGIPNVVTSILASYRGFDTLGEVTVIFTAGIGVLVLLGRGRNSRAE